MLIGVGLIYAATRFPDSQHEIFLPKLIEHLGIAFIVSSIAVVFYEWGGHYKHGVELASELESIKQAVGANALEGALRALVHGERREWDEEIVADVKAFVLSIKDLHEKGDWAKYGYARYLRTLLHKARENAGSLSVLSTQSGEGVTHGEYTLNILSATSATDAMLSEQLSRLSQDGSYSVVSNVGSWLNNQLQSLDRESRLAVEKKGVKIRRIFVIGDRAAHKQHNTAENISKVLGDHLAKSNAWKGNGSYEIKLLNQQELSRLMQKIPESAEFIFEHHFGIFAKREEDLCIRVEVKRPDLSDLRVRGLPEASEEICFFEEVWGELPLLTEEILKGPMACLSAHQEQHSSLSAVPGREPQ